MNMHRIVIVGGGVGGLELATRLGKYWGAKCRQPKAAVTLVDIKPTHVWKPLLHEVAAGSLDVEMHQLEYAAQAQWCGFHFQQGALQGLERESRTITLSPVIDQDGVLALPERKLSYDTLILSLGSVTNFFNVPGAAKYSFALDNAKQAEQFRRRLMTACLNKEQSAASNRFSIAIVGGGATGVELAAELRHTLKAFKQYGLHRLDEKIVKITIIEAAPRILPALPERTAHETAGLLKKLSIEIKTQASVIQVEEKAVHLHHGEKIDADLIVWAAGIKAPPILSNLEGLTVNRQGQVVVNSTLQSISDAHIFALGDCASTPWLGYPAGTQVPPRAQAAHQQSRFLFKALRQRLTGNKINQSFHYRDFGSLVSLGHRTAVGNLKDGITRQGLFVRGWIARWMYASLYRLHIAALHGWPRMILHTLGQWLSRSTRPRVKLH